MKKSTKKTLIIVVIAMAATMLLGFATSGFTNWNKDDMKAQFEKQVNPDNFYTVECLTDNLKANDGNGVYFEIDEETGAIVADGVAQDDYEVEFATVKLNKGKYTITAIEDASYASIYVDGKIGDTQVKVDFTGNTFDVAGDNTTLTLTLHIVKGTKLNNVKILPVIVSGEEAGDFYK